MIKQRRIPVQQRSRAMVATILEAAARVFDERGYRATTTNHVAARAGVSIGSLYQYFPNKDALLVALAEQHLEAAEQLLAAVATELESTALPLRDLLAMLVDAAMAEHADDRGLHAALFHHAPRLPELVERVRDFERRVSEVLASHLRRLDVGGPDPELTARLVVEGINGHVHGSGLDVTADPGVVRDAIVALWSRALGDLPA